MPARFTLARQDSGQFQITCQIPQSQVKQAEQQALQQLAASVKVEGFRPGKAPLDKVKQQLKPETVTDKILQILLPDLYQKALTEHKLQPIVNPEVRLVKTPADGEWEIQFTAVEFPQIDLSSAYKQIKGIFKSSKIWTPSDSGKKASKTKSKASKTKAKAKSSASQPADKPASAESKINQVLQFIVDKVELALPEMLVRQERERLLSNFLDQVKKPGLTLDQYLQGTGKTAEQLQADYQQEAARNVKIELVLAQVVNDQKLTVKPEEIDQLIKQTGDEKLQQSLNNPQSRRQIEVSLLKRRALDYLVKLAE